MPEALAYLITFTCYGARLHGNPKGSVSRSATLYNTPILQPHRPLEATMEALMTHPAATLTAPERAVVLNSIVEVCAHTNWHLHAAHVRTNHVHIVVTAHCPPEQVMSRLKAYATRHLNQTFGARPRRWTDHGSTRYLRNEISVNAAIEYVLSAQGATISAYPATPDPEPEA